MSRPIPHCENRPLVFRIALRQDERYTYVLERRLREAW